MKTNTYEDFINAGYSPARARALSADSNTNWKAKNGGKRKTSKAVPEPEPETLKNACDAAFGKMTKAGVPPAKAAGFLLRGLLSILAEESAKKAPQEKGGED